MIQNGVRGNKKSKIEELIIMSKIQKLLASKNDDEIMQIVELPNSTYYRYKAKVYKEAKKIWKQVCQETLEHRALLIKKTLDICIRVNEEIATDPKQLAKDRIQASQSMVEAQLNMLKLLREGHKLIADSTQGNGAFKRSF